MELKVWVDGIQRVVCGATVDTTCQDVVVALAHAMGRTGRFTLIEKFRDIDRPLGPTECPLKVLHKWGEYAPQVRFLLCQADVEQQKPLVKEKERVLKTAAGTRPIFSPRSQSHLGPTHEVTVKRALTFSGVHGMPTSHSFLQPNTSAPTTKMRRTHLGRVPIDENKVHNKVPPSSSPLSLQSSNHSSSRQAELLGVGEGRTEQKDKVSSGKQAQQHPVPPPRKRMSPVMQQDENKRIAAQDAGVSWSVSSSSSSSLSPSSSVENCGSDRLPSSLFYSPQQCQSFEARSPRITFRQSCLQPDSSVQSQGASHSPDHPGDCVQDLEQSEELGKQPSSVAPCLPLSLPPCLPTIHSPPASAQPPLLKSSDLTENHQRALVDLESSFLGDSHSQQASLEVEEYDLDSNFPDSYRDSGDSEHPGLTVEYRLDDGMGSGVTSHQDSEHAKLVWLVSMQQERLKTQASQIDDINTEITSLEEHEREYEEKLQGILSELLQLENMDRDMEPEVSRLENVEWDNILDSETKREQDLQHQIAECHAQLAIHQEKIEQLRERERELSNDVEAEKVRIQQEQEAADAEETRGQEEADKLANEVAKVQADLLESDRTGREREAILAEVESTVKVAEAELEEQQLRLQKLEQELKEENLKSLIANPSRDDLQRQESGETILKILEGRLSPRPPSTSGTLPDSTSLPPFIAALAAKTPSGVWV